MKFCLPIQRTTIGQVEELIDLHITNTTYDAFEIWLDMVEDLTLNWLSRISLRLKDKAIFLLRRPHLEKPHKSKYFQQDALSLLAMSDSYIDLDVLTQTEELNYFLSLRRSERSQLIASYHNYTSTPDDSQLKIITEALLRSHPHVVKVSTFCESEEDALRLLVLGLHFRSAGHRYIVLGMSPFGQVTRIFGSLWGNEFIFAPFDRDDSSAAGQLTITKYRTIMEMISGG